MAGAFFGHDFRFLGLLQNQERALERLLRTANLSSAPTRVPSAVNRGGLIEPNRAAD
jgi:hypothetical protein